MGFAGKRVGSDFLLGNVDLKMEPETMSPLALAYIGDAVYELYVRLILTSQGTGKMKDLHRRAVSFVKAGTQAQFLKELEPWLSKKEADIVRWGRNAKSGHVPKSAGVLEYRYSTGFEALLGYLYLKGYERRLGEILTELGKWMESRSSQEG